MAPTVVVSRRGADRLRRGHPWVYRTDVGDADAAPGDLVRVTSEHDRGLGWAFWSSTSQIALRLVSAEPGRTPPDERALYRQRLRSAAGYRASLDIDASAYRLLHAEADRLPSTIVDRYADVSGEYLVVQTLSQGADRRLPLLTETLVDEFAPRGILARNDPKVRRLEGLDQRVEVVHGEVPDRIAVREGALTFDVDVRHGQKTGMFLDQRENHQTAARYARGRVLDAFAYNGGFALPMAAGADTVLALDSSSTAVAATLANASANGITNIEIRERNVFDELRELTTGGERFDLVVLDPPAFAKNRAAVDRAAAGYKEINLRAMQLLSPGGHLITCSCSYNVDEAMFLAILEAAAADAQRALAVVERRTQARDHPVLLSMPETQYLKCIVLRRLD